MKKPIDPNLDNILDDILASESKASESVLPKKEQISEEIKNEILDSLKKESLSASSLYLKMGYKGNISKTFRSCIKELIEEGRIEFKEKDKNSSSNALILKK